ncbi:hypothetical protein Tco_0720000 [Tanacetum coccineum]
MATFEFCDKHNMVPYLEKPEGSAEFHHIIDFLTASHIYYALTEHLKLKDDGGITSLPNTEIFEQLDLIGVHSLGRDEGSVSLIELMDMVTQLTTKVGNLENELMNTKKVYGSALTKLVNRVKKLEKQVKTGTARRGTKIVLSEDEAVKEDSSKQGRSLIDELDMDADFSLVPLHDAKIQEKISDDTEVTTADTTLNTATVPFSTAISLVYIRRSAKKKKDKGKAIVIEDESVQKKSKKKVQEERLGYKEAIRLQEQINEEERKRIARDAEIAKQLPKEYDKVGKKEVVTEVDISHVIDWDDLVVIRYHALQNKPRSVADVRKNMMVWDQIHSFMPMDSEEEVKRLKRAGQDVEGKLAKRQITKEVSESAQEQIDELSQEQLNQMVIIIPDEGINIEALQTKYLIIGIEVHSNDTMQFWKIIRVGNHTEVYQVFEDMLKNFNRDDLIKLWSLVQESKQIKEVKCLEASSAEYIRRNLRFDGADMGLKWVGLGADMGAEMGRFAKTRIATVFDDKTSAVVTNRLGIFFKHSEFCVLGHIGRRILANKMSSFAEKLHNEANKVGKMSETHWALASVIIMRMRTACFSLEEYHTAKTAFQAGCKLAPDDARFTYQITKCEKCIAAKAKSLCDFSLQVLLAFLLI